MKTIITSLDKRFRLLHESSLQFIDFVPDEILYKRPRAIEQMYSVFSIGECLIRSAAIIEQVVGGITTRLWDDPFEWTLPEELQTGANITGYLNEVETARINGFAYFMSDEDLAKHVPAPEQMHLIFDLLTESLSRSSHFQGRSFAIFQMLSSKKLPRI